MSKAAIVIEGLGKRYTIGQQKADVDGMRTLLRARFGTWRLAEIASRIKTEAGGLLGTQECDPERQPGRGCWDYREERSREEYAP